MLHALGTVGLLLVLGAYFLNSSGRVTAQDARFQLMNLLGAAILIAYSAVLEAWASVALNVVWAMIAGNSLWRTRRR